MAAHYVSSLPGILAGILLSPRNQPSIIPFVCVCVGKAPYQCLCHQFCRSPLLLTACVLGHPRMLCHLHCDSPQGICYPSNGSGLGQAAQITQNTSVWVQLHKMIGRGGGESSFFARGKIVLQRHMLTLVFLKPFAFPLSIKWKKLWMWLRLPWPYTTIFLSGSFHGEAQSWYQGREIWAQCRSFYISHLVKMPFFNYIIHDPYDFCRILCLAFFLPVYGIEQAKKVHFPVPERRDSWCYGKEKRTGIICMVTTCVWLVNSFVNS